MEEQLQGSVLIAEAANGFDFTKLALLYVFNLAYPFIQLLTSSALNGSYDCYDSCATYFIPLIFGTLIGFIIWGFPLLGMVIFRLF